jgi:hypothetical protein
VLESLKAILPKIAVSRAVRAIKETYESRLTILPNQVGFGEAAGALAATQSWDRTRTSGECLHDS